MVPFLIFIHVFKNAAFTEISSHAFSLDNIKINFQFELTFSFAMSLCMTIYSCMCFLHCARYRLHHEHLLLMKSPVGVYPLCSIFSYCKEIKHACQFVFPMRSIMIWHAGWDIFSPPCSEFISQTHTVMRTHIAVSASLQLVFVFLTSHIFFPPQTIPCALWMLGRNNRNNNLGLIKALLYAILIYLVDCCFA